MLSILNFICEGSKFHLHCKDLSFTNINYLCQGERTGERTDKRDSLFGR